MEKKLTMSVTNTHEFTSEEIGDLVSTALEGGINYWCGKALKKRNEDKTFFGVAPEDQEKIEYASDLIGYNGVLILCDAETPDRWELTLEKMLKGIQKYCTERNIAPSALMDDYDVETVDCIVQYALFDEIVFG